MKVQQVPLKVAALSAVLALSACSSGTSPKSNDDKSDVNVGSVASTCAKQYNGPLKDVADGYPEPTKQGLKIGFLQPLGANEAVLYIQKFVEKEVAALGGKTVSYDASGQPDKQVTQMEQLLNQKVDAVIVFPLDASALKPVVAQAKAANVPVIGIEVNPDPAGDIGDFTTQVVQGRDEQAYIHACVMSKLHPGAEVATVGFAVPVPSIATYMDRVTFWAKDFGLKVVDTADNQTDDVAGGEKVTSALLAKHPKLKGILAYNDPSAIGASTAARTQSRELTVFGVNGASEAFAAIKAGKQDLTVQYPELDWAKELVWAAYDAVQKPDVALPKVTYPSSLNVVTKDNVEDARTWKQQLDEGN